MAKSALTGITFQIWQQSVPERLTVEDNNFWQHFVIGVTNPPVQADCGEVLFGTTLLLVLQMVPCTGRM